MYMLRGDICSYSPFQIVSFGVSEDLLDLAGFGELLYYTAREGPTIPPFGYSTLPSQDCISASNNKGNDKIPKEPRNPENWNTFTVGISRSHK
ncbi:hypothetical protein KC19_1G180000 [Ceratodon purpureus]|uniref:Uncharacterized protein n=1 Tax=Ceratodon purpureus TaxID=3225 RepID=A0A8T0J6G0_CERPU|nr:hypothetical protein KC19_1G180000 [Ceratodon purpureus]